MITMSTKTNCLGCRHTSSLHPNGEQCRALGCKCTVFRDFRRGAEAARLAHLESERAENEEILIFAGIETDEPKFRVSEVAKVFFARSPHWVRWREREGHTDYFDQKINGRSDPNAGARSYTLVDVERMARGLAQHGAIDERQLAGALMILRGLGGIYGYLSPIGGDG